MKYFLISEISRNTGDVKNIGLVINIQDAVSFIQAVNSECGEMTTRHVPNEETGLWSTEFRFEHSQCNYFVVEEVKVIQNVQNQKVYY